ncbi:hypothetical protein D3C76_1781840 [compost metagenome]
MNLEYIRKYDEQITPCPEHYLDDKNRKKTQWHKTRADKDTRYHMFDMHKISVSCIFYV